MEPPAAGLVAATIRGRRTCKSFTGAPVDRPVLEAALALAQWAPTHRLSEPWRFYVLEQRGITRLAAFLRIDPAFAATRADSKACAKLERLIERLPQAGALILATWVRAEAPAIDLEDHAAAAAAVQTLLLALESTGIASYWSTSAPLIDPETLRWFGVDPDREGTVGCIWVGHAAGSIPVPPRRPLEERVRWLDTP